MNGTAKITLVVTLGDMDDRIDERVNERMNDRMDEHGDSRALEALLEEVITGRLPNKKAELLAFAAKFSAS